MLEQQWLNEPIMIQYLSISLNISMLFELWLIDMIWLNSCLIWGCFRSQDVPRMFLRTTLGTRVVNLKSWPRGVQSSAAAGMPLRRSSVPCSKVGVQFSVQFSLFSCVSYPYLMVAHPTTYVKVITKDHLMSSKDECPTITWACILTCCNIALMRLLILKRHPAFQQQIKLQ